MLIWKARMNRADQQLHDALQDSVRIGATSAGFCASGPGQLFADEAGLMPHLADLWADSSLQMHRLCASNQIEYYHFLQPTRHFPTTDPTDEDRAEGYIPPTIQAGYPLLQQQGALLQDQGVAFTDLTEMFEPLQSGVYTDAAHLNKPANDRLAERIAHSIAEYRSRP